MCYLGVLNRKSGLSLDLLKNAFDHNSDGWGIMYAQGGRVVSIKEKSGLKRFYKAWETVPEDCNVAVHFRFGTSGPKNAKACHPFALLEKSKGDPIDLFLMHNGVLRHFDGTNAASDTMQYCEALASQLRRCPELLKDRYWREAQEQLLGNPNKIVLLEGNGRWHYFNYQQGERDKETGVWHSNTYSLRPVYSGFGKGKAAQDKKWLEEDDWQLGGYYGGWVARNDSGKLIAEAACAVRPTVRDEPNWAMSFAGDEKERTQLYWKKTSFGWVRMGKNPSTGAFFRDFWKPGEKPGADIATVLPRDCIRFTPKNEKAWERGDRHNIELQGGEYVAEPISPIVTLYTSTEARAAVTTGATDKPVATFPLAEDAAGAGPNITGVLAALDAAEERAMMYERLGEPLDRVICGDSGEPCDMNCDAGHGCKETRSRVAVLAARDEEEEEQSDDEYLNQLFSSQNLRDMSEEELTEACEQYPEEAALALGRAHNARWAWEEVS